MEDKILHMKSDNPLYNCPESVKFEDYYKKYCSMKIPINKQKGKKKFINKSKENKCCFCGDENIGTNFRNESHIVPAAFGNKTFFSKDECDSCNKKFGDAFESELSEMFLIERLLNGIPKRNNKLPKYKHNSEDGSTVENLGSNTLLFVNNKDQLFRDAFGSIKYEKNESNNKIVLPCKYKPIGVVKSLVHMMWLLLDDETRNNNNKLLDWYQGNNDIFPLYLNYGSIKELTNDIVTFTIWEKHKNDNKYADFILVFTFSNNIVLFEVPCFNCSEYKPCILPPLIIETDIEKIDFSMIMLEIKSNEKRVDGSKSISFETTEISSIGKIDLNGNRDIDNLKRVVKENSEIAQIKKNIKEINAYYNITIPVDIKLNKMAKDHIYNLALCASYNGNYTFPVIKSYKVEMNSSFTQIIDAINSTKLPFIKILENRVFKIGIVEIKYTKILNITNPSCRKSKNKAGIEFVNFRGDKIIETLNKYK